MFSRVESSLPRLPAHVGALLLTAALLLPLRLEAQQAVAYKLPPADYVQQLAEKIRAVTGAPGLELGLGASSSAPIVVGSGSASLENATPVAGSDCFPAASISKMFTAVVVLQLAGEGRLSLDDPLARYVPDFPAGERITVRMLLSHRSGVQDYLDLQLSPLIVPLISLQTYTPPEIAAFFGQRGLLFPPGSGFHYSNINYILLGLVIEAAGGDSYAAQVRRRIIEPLELRHTLIAGSDALPPSTLRGYMLVDGELRDTTLWENPSLAWAAGAIVSNGEDLLAFADALFHGRLLSDELLRQMMDCGPTGNGTLYGLGLASYELPGGRVYGHTGETLGFSTALYYQPDTGRSFVLLANLAHVSNQTALEVLQDYFTASYDAPAAAIPRGDG